MSVYIRPQRPPGRHHDDAAETAAFRDQLITAINEDSRVREAVLRLFATDRARKKAVPAPSARARRGGT